MLGVITRTARQIEREPTHKATLFLIIFAQLVCQKVLLTRFVIYYFKKKKSTPRYTLPQKIACGAHKSRHVIVCNMSCAIRRTAFAICTIFNINVLF